MELKENTTIADLDTNIVSTESIENWIKEVEKLYVNAFINIGTYDYLDTYLKEEVKNEKSKESKGQIEQQRESNRQTKLATIKMLKSHTSNIEELKKLLTIKQ